MTEKDKDKTIENGEDWGGGLRGALKTMIRKVTKAVGPGSLPRHPKSISTSAAKLGEFIEVSSHLKSAHQRRQLNKTTEEKERKKETSRSRKGGLAVFVLGQLKRFVSLSFLAAPSFIKNTLLGTLLFDSFEFIEQQLLLSPDAYCNSPIIASVVAGR